MYRRESARSKPASQGHPSRGGTTVGGGTKSKPVAYKRPSSKPVVRPDVTLGGDETPKRSGHSKPPKVSKSAPPRPDRPYTRTERAEVKQQKRFRKAYAKQLFNPKLNAPGMNKLARENFWTEPVKLERNNFTAVSKEMWKRLGLKGKMPKIVYNDVPKMKNDEAYAYRGHNAVYVEPRLPMEAQRNRGEYSTFAHEAAHTRQHEGQKGVEGLATEFARTKGMEALRKMGVKGRWPGSSPSYARAAKRVRKHRKRRYVTKGQFEE